MRQGLMLAVFFCINLLLSFVTTMWVETAWVISLCSVLSNICTIWIIILTYYITRFYRDIINGGNLTYGEGAGIIISTFFFASILTAGFRLALILWKPEYLSTLFSQSLEALKTLSLPEDITLQLNNSIEQLQQPVNFVFQYIWVDTLLGILLALPMALTTRRTQANNNSSDNSIEPDTTNNSENSEQ